MEFNLFLNSYLNYNRFDISYFNQLFNEEKDIQLNHIENSTTINSNNKAEDNESINSFSKISEELEIHQSKKDMPRVQEFIPFSRDYIHHFTKKDKIYKSSSLYIYSKPDNNEVSDPEFISDQSDDVKIQYLSDTISKYKQLFGFPQNEVRFRNENTNDSSIKKFKNNIIKTSSITKMQDNYSTLYYLRSSGIVERAYLSILARYSLFKNNTFSKNISLHFPFTEIERLILKNSNINEKSSLKDLYNLTRELPGRAPVDIIRYLKDEAYCRNNENLKKLDVLLRNHEKENNLFIKDIDSNKDVRNDFGIYKTIYSDKKEDILDVNKILMDNEMVMLINQSKVKSNERKLVKHYTKDFSKITVLANGGESVLDVKFDPTGYTSKVMVLSKGKNNNNSILYDYKTQTTQSLILHEKQCNEGHFSIDGSKVITCGKDGRIATWSADSGDLIGHYEHETRSPCLRLNIHRTNELAVTGFKDKSMVLYNYGTNQYFDLNSTQKLDDWPSAVTDLSFGYGKNSEYVAAGIGSITDEAVKGFVTVIDSNRPDEYLNLFVQQKDVSSIAWNPKLHDCLASASNDPERSICIYDLRDRVPTALTMKTNQEDVNICCYSPCGNYVSISGTPNYTYVFDTRNCSKPFRELRHKITNQNSSNDVPKLVNHAQWSRNCEYFATCADDGTVRLWDIENDKQLIALEHAPFPGVSINYFDISLNSDLIVSGGDDGGICIFGV